MEGNASAEATGDDLAPTMTAGYKAPAQKTMEEMKNLDQDDESLQKWKESLLKNATASPKDDPRKVVVLSLAMEVEGRPDVTLDLSTPEGLEVTKTSPITIKEGVDYRMKVKFRVQHDVISGLKYLHVVKRKGLKVDKAEEMIGSYAPNATPYEKKFVPEQAPGGMIARGTYTVKSKFTDDDGTSHLEWEWQFQIKKEWE
eukprot:Partr_v1_DN23736_c0_g3_i1_m53097 putative Rho GDP dissociation inhibitor (GDI)